MGIRFYNHTFHLSNERISYIIGIVEGLPVHLYWGKRLAADNDFSHITGTQVFARVSAFSPLLDDTKAGEDRIFVEDMQLEFPIAHMGDYREPIFQGEQRDGSNVFEFSYNGCRIEKGKPKLNGLPATYTEGGDEAQTLFIEMLDRKTGVKATLTYTIFEDYDAVAKSILYENTGAQTVKITSALSSCVDFWGMDYKLLHLNGAWDRERHIEYVPVGHGAYRIESRRGYSSHNENPFLAVMDKNACDTFGDVYGFSLVYSGSFAASCEVSTFGAARVMIGINPFNFAWELEPDTAFQTPEAVLAFSPDGLDAMSKIYHGLYAKRLVRGKYRDIPRPILINNWEGTRYHFNEEKLLNIASNARDIGLEMLVLDDGWYGKRNDSTSSLGDWWVNEEKLPGGLSRLIKGINGMGMKFGLWFEPEMVSPDSELYRTHPDWCIHIGGRKRTTAKNCLVLDLSRREVREYILGFMTKILNENNIEYVKWDCNRNFTEVGSAAWPPEKQREVGHRYVLGLYEILETLTSRFPNILFEGCSGGGGRFDPGMLYYMPQHWCSDNTDPIDRLYIQYGTSVVYPPNTMGAHVARSPIEISKRNVSLAMRGFVAMSGSYGFELDLSEISAEEKADAAAQIAQYKQIRELLQLGGFYRLENPFDGDYASWQFVSRDKEKTVAFFFQKVTTYNGADRRVKLKGLSPQRIYTYNGRQYSGELLMNAGIRIPHQPWDYAAQMMIFE